VLGGRARSQQRGDDLRLRWAEVEAGREAACCADAGGAVGIDGGVEFGLGVDIGRGGFGGGGVGSVAACADAGGTSIGLNQ
jgi:hypothetical protein